MSWRFLLGVAAAAGVIAGSYCAGASMERTAAALRQQEAVNDATLKQMMLDRAGFEQAQTASALAAPAAAAQVEIRWRTRTLVEKVTEYVTPAADADCRLPVGWVRVHDAAAAGRADAGPAAPGADDAGSGVACSDAAAVVSENYGAYQAVARQLSDLQAWARVVSGQPPAQPGS